jgi:malate dehydrogenase (oxaloacetate-decarboxylating)(NADP+)
MNPNHTRHARGLALLQDPRSNKGTAFSDDEREHEKLVGLLPESVEDIEMQRRRVLQHLGHKPNDIERYVYLIGLLDRNETLFYRVLMADPARFLPIVYDPTVGEACQKFGHIYRRSGGMYLSMKRAGKVREVLKNWPERDVRFICVSTGERILGLGDLGANGMGIPIGKLQLYTACAAVPPDGLLPMLLDCGTNNHELLDDPLYLGLRQPRPSTEQLDAFVEEFVQAAQEVFPGCCIHFEDWKGTDALRLLAKYRDKVCCYNDDIQGTGSVTVAGLLSALRITGGKLKDQRVLFLGAGSAGIGISDMIVSAMQLEGLPESEARDRISLFDIGGLVESSRKDLNSDQQRYAHRAPSSRDFAATIRALKPTAIIGVSTQGKAFNRDVVEAMTRLRGHGAQSRPDRGVRERLAHARDGPEPGHRLRQGVGHRPQRPRSREDAEGGGHRDRLDRRARVRRSGRSTEDGASRDAHDPAHRVDVTTRAPGATWAPSGPGRHPTFVGYRAELPARTLALDGAHRPAPLVSRALRGRRGARRLQQLVGLLGRKRQGR